MTAGEIFFRWLVRAGRAAGLLTLLFMLVPILVIIPLSFTSGSELVYPVPSYGLRWYADFFTRPEWLNSIRVSLLVGAGAATLATILGTMAALGLQHLPKRVRDAVAALLILPMAIPTVIGAVAFFFFYARLNLAGTYIALMLAHATLGLPFVVINVRAALTGLSGDFARAAASLGARPHRVFIRVTAPLIAPGIATGALFAFAVSLDDVVVAMFVGGPSQLTLPRQMFNGLRENISPTILAAATLLTLVSIGLMVATSRLSARARRMGQT
jgi:putative spermidine/putrescine transport system permease protein